MKIKLPKNKYVIYVKYQKGYKQRKTMFYNVQRYEILLDAYWMFVFGGAEQVTLAMANRRNKSKIVLHNLDEWRVVYTKYFGNGQYMVWRNRFD